jgi:hypothetical protein
MPALAATRYEALVTWTGLVGDREAALPSRPVPALDLTFAGPKGEAHGGLTRPSCSRVMGLFPRGTTIRNTRQLSVLSAEDLEAIAAKMGLPALDPSLIGATLVVRGLPDFSHLPPSSRLLADSGACLVVDMENRPCTLPARPIETAHPGFGARFKAAAQGRRGITAWVEAEGRLAPGDRLRLFVPDQPVWAGARDLLSP